MVEIYDNRPTLKKDFENDIHNIKQRHIKEILSFGKELRQKQEFFISCGTGLNRAKADLRELTSIEKVGDIMLDVAKAKQDLIIQERMEQLKNAKAVFEFKKKQLKTLKSKHRQEIQQRKKELAAALEKEFQKLKREKKVLESM